MKKILAILLLIGSVAQGQTLLKNGKADGITSYFGIHKYNVHPSWSLSDSLWLVNRKYVDSLFGTAGGGITSINSETGPAITFTAVNGLTRTTNTNNIEYKMGGTFTENTSLAMAGFNLSLTGTGNMGIGVAAGSERLRVSGRGHFTDTLTDAVAIKAGAFIQGATVSAKIMTDGEMRALGGFNTTSPALNNNTFTGLISNELRYGGIATLSFQNIGSNNVNVNQLALTGTYNPTSGAANTLNTVYISPSLVPVTATNNLIYNMIRVTPIVNQGAFGLGITRGLLIDPTLTSAVDWRSIEVVNGPVMFNTTSGRTQIGTSSAASNINPRKFYVDGSVGVHKDSISTITSLTSQFLLAQDTATGANLGRFYKILSSNLGFVTSNIYSADGTLSGNRELSGASNSLSLGTAGSKFSLFNLFSSGDNFISSDDQNIISGGLVVSRALAGDADFTITTAMQTIMLPQISADRALTLPTPSNGQIFIIHNENSAGFAWNITGTLQDKANGSVTSLANDTVYIIQGISTTHWKIVTIY